MSALENVMLPMIYGGVPPQERKERAIAALTKVKLDNRLHNKPNQLSGGQQTTRRYCPGDCQSTHIITCR
jgi:putative ABC transport system ATP-binding protein